MTTLLHPGLWLAALLLALSVGGTAYLKGAHDGKASIRAEWDRTKAEAEREARRVERAQQANVDEAAQMAARREAGIRADAARARAESSGLRDDLAAVRANAELSANAARDSVAALADVFGQCVRRYSELAEEADRHASDSMTLQKAWPR